MPLRIKHQYYIKKTMHSVWQGGCILLYCHNLIILILYMSHSSSFSNSIQQYEKEKLHRKILFIQHFNLHVRNHFFHILYFVLI